MVPNVPDLDFPKFLRNLILSLGKNKTFSLGLCFDNFLKRKKIILKSGFTK